MMIDKTFFDNGFVEQHNDLHREKRIVNIQAFNDPEGKTSISRIVYAFVVVLFMSTWAVISIKSGAMVMIDPEWIGILAVFAGQKATQSFAENKK